MAYFIETTLVWASLYFLYLALLRRETFHRANRFYLLAALVAGLLLPFLPAWFVVEESAAAVLLLEPITVGLKALEEQGGQSGNPVLLILKGVWALGAALAAARLLWGLRQIMALARQAQKEKNQGFTLLRTAVWHPPFSFLGWVFFSKNEALPADEYHAVLRHEQAHVRQRHSLDVLLLEALAIPFWWNPLIYLYRRSLRQLHEHLADEYVLGELPLHQYGQLLIRQTLTGQPFAIANFFNRSLLKTRINMMTKTSSKPSAGWKFLLTLPLLAFLLLNFCTTEQSPAAPLRGEVDEMPVWQGCETEGSAEARSTCSNGKLMNFLVENIKYPADAAKQKLEGKVYVSYVVTKAGKVSDVKVKKSVHPLLDAEALRVVKALPKMVPAKKDGKSVSAEVNLPISFRLD